MPQPALYLNLMRLYAYNKHLIGMYSKLIQSEEEDEEFSDKEILKIRLKERNRIRRELASCLQDVKKNYYSNIRKKTMVPWMKLIVNTEMVARQVLIPTNWNGCYKCEKQSIKLYYKTLYSNNVPHQMTNVLLHQKTQIENYLHNETPIF